MELNLRTVATLKHINLRQEGSAEDSALAYDLKFVCLVPADLIDTLICVDNEGEALQAFWRDDKDGKPRFPQLGGLSFQRRLNEIEFNTLGLHLPGCKVGGFSFEALDGRHANLQFSVAVSSPPGNALPILADFLKQDIEIELLSQQRDLLAEQPDNVRPILREAKTMLEEIRDLEADLGEQYDPIPLASDEDELLGSARAFVLETHRASISALQRYLKVGYNRAARLIEALELEGTVTAMNSNGGREVIRHFPAEGA